MFEYDCHSNINFNISDWFMRCERHSLPVLHTNRAAANARRKGVGHVGTVRCWSLAAGFRALQGTRPTLPGRTGRLWDVGRRKWVRYDVAKEVSREFRFKLFVVCLSTVYDTWLYLVMIQTLQHVTSLASTFQKSTHNVRISVSVSTSCFC